MFVLILRSVLCLKLKSLNCLNNFIFIICWNMRILFVVDCILLVVFWCCVLLFICCYFKLCGCWCCCFLLDMVLFGLVIFFLRRIVLWCLFIFGLVLKGIGWCIKIWLLVKFCFSGLMGCNCISSVVRRWIKDCIEYRLKIYLFGLKICLVREMVCWLILLLYYLY